MHWTVDTYCVLNAIHETTNFLLQALDEIIGHDTAYTEETGSCNGFEVDMRRFHIHAAYRILSLIQIHANTLASSRLLTMKL